MEKQTRTQICKWSCVPSGTALFFFVVFSIRFIFISTIFFSQNVLRVSGNLIVFWSWNSLHFFTQNVVFRILENFFIVFWFHFSCFIFIDVLLAKTSFEFQETLWSFDVEIRFIFYPKLLHRLLIFILFIFTYFYFFGPIFSQNVLRVSGNFIVFWFQFAWFIFTYFCRKRFSNFYLQLVDFELFIFVAI